MPDQINALTRCERTGGLLCAISEREFLAGYTACDERVKASTEKAIHTLAEWVGTVVEPSNARNCPEDRPIDSPSLLCAALLVNLTV